MTGQRKTKNEKGKTPFPRLGVEAIAMMMVAATALLAQEPPRPFQTAVNYVRVDMYPIADGRPVTDLQQAEVEVLEDGVLQKIEQFEHVHISGPRPQTTRREPSSVEEMRRAAQDPRARIMVLFIDPRHVDLWGSMRVRQPLVDALNKLIGGDDLIAVMTPTMSARALAFRRRTGSVEQLLAEYWGKKDWSGSGDPTELMYEGCYSGKRPASAPPDASVVDIITGEMIRRRREVQTLDALEELSQYLRGVREERKAVITISGGWPLYGPSRMLMEPLVDPQGNPAPMPVPRVGRDPRTGRPALRDPDSVVISSGGADSIDRLKCENDRVTLANLKHEQRFVGIMQASNRANVSFYPIDPAALSAGPSLDRDRSLHMMAELTDGLGIFNAGDIDRGFQRIVDDLSSYYLLGYYSTAKSDGRFHRITVRVKRPGVQVRARAGYLAATAAEAAAPPSSTTTSVDTSEARIMSQALGTLSAFSRDRPVHVQTAAGWTATGPGRVWVVTEISRNAEGSDFSKGGEINVRLTGAGGETIATEQAAVQPTAGASTVRVTLSPQIPLAAGDYQVHVRAKGAGSLPSSEVVRMSLPAESGTIGALFTRRGPSTGNRELPTADLRFRRTDRLILEIPAASSDAISARLLDRTGRALTIPVTATIRTDADGMRWRRVEIALAPLAPADYIIESTAGSERTLTAFRVVP